MSEKYYTVDEIAELIKIHPKTLRRYIREGKLKAMKVGKNWRISGHDLSIFTEGRETAAAPQLISGEKTGEKETMVSAVIDIHVADVQESVRIANTITAITNSKPPGYGATSLQTQYLISENVMRVMVWGNLSFAQIILDSIAALAENYEA